MNTNYSHSTSFTGTLKFAKALQLDGKIVKEHEIDAKKIRQIMASPDIKNSTQITLDTGESFIVEHPFKEVFPIADQLRRYNSVEYFA